MYTSLFNHPETILYILPICEYLHKEGASKINIFNVCPEDPESMRYTGLNISIYRFNNDPYIQGVP